MVEWTTTLKAGVFALLASVAHSGDLLAQVVLDTVGLWYPLIASLARLAPHTWLPADTMMSLFIGATATYAVLLFGRLLTALFRRFSDS